MISYRMAYIRQSHNQPRKNIMNLARDKGYKTIANAEKKLKSIVGDLSKIHYVIAVNADGRYVPCAIGKDNWDLIHAGITVLG